MKLTGAIAALSANHRDQSTGHVHGHKWQITVWAVFKGQSAELLQYQLEQWIARQPQCLPDRIAWAEEMAQEVARDFSNEHTELVEVLIEREAEGLLARWKPEPRNSWLQRLLKGTPNV